MSKIFSNKKIVSTHLTVPKTLIKSNQKRNFINEREFTCGVIFITGGIFFCGFVTGSLFTYFQMKKHSDTNNDSS